MKCYYILLLIWPLVACQAIQSEPRQTPSQVVYRFDDHRYLTLVGYYCQGALWYTDTQLGIHSEVIPQFYRLFTHAYIHPSKRYIAIAGWQVDALLVSKDYGRSWQVAPFANVFPGAEANGDTQPAAEDVESFTVVNDQGFLKTKQGLLYISSKPFNDPRSMPGGPGISYIDEYGAPHHLRAGSIGPEWGLEYFEPNTLKNNIVSLKTNYQQLPQKVPEVKNYPGWTHMRCDYNLGLKQPTKPLNHQS